MALRLAGFVEELKRRKVFGTAGVYLVSAFVVMQVVDAVFPYLPVPDPEAAGAVVLLILAVGFPIALGLSWLFDITPPQLRREVAVPQATPPERRDRRPSRALQIDAVAVLPFENLSDTQEDRYFSDGITEDIVASVARIRGLRVLSRSAVTRAGQTRPVAEIAAELGVAHVIAGSVRRSESRVRIVATLIAGANEDVLWSATYDRELRDIFEVQSEVAASIATAVRRELTAADRVSIASRGTTNPEAYDSFLRARALWEERTEATVGASLRFFEHAIEVDPEFALAHASLAEAYTILGIYGARPPSDVFPLARRAATTALALNPSLGEAVAASACVSAVFDWDWEAAERGFLDALSLSPSYPTAHQWYAMNLLVPCGRFADALAELEQAHQLDPGSSAIAVSRGIVAFYARDFTAATGELERACTEHPRFGLAHFFLGLCRTFSGQQEAGLAALAAAVALSDESSETLSAYGFALAVAGRRGEAEEILERLRARTERRYVSQTLVAQLLVGLGRHDEALEQLRAAVAARATDLIWLAVRPHYDPLRGSDGFARVLDQVDLIEPGRPAPRGRADPGVSATSLPRPGSAS